MDFRYSRREGHEKYDRPLHSRTIQCRNNSAGSAAYTLVMHRQRPTIRLLALNKFTFDAAQEEMQYDCGWGLRITVCWNGSCLHICLETMRTLCVRLSTASTRDRMGQYYHLIRPSPNIITFEEPSSPSCWGDISKVSFEGLLVKGPRPR
jgi:hypothetical protein